MIFWEKIQKGRLKKRPINMEILRCFLKNFFIFNAIYNN